MEELGNIFGAMGDLARDAWRWVSAWQAPSRGELLTSIREIGPVQAAVMLVGGLIYLLQGWRVFKFLVVINAALAGMVLGSIVGGRYGGEEWSVYGALIGGAVLAILCWPLLRVALTLMGALAGGAAGMGVWAYAAHWHPSIGPYAWVGGLVGALLLGVLAFFLFRLVVIVITSLQGSAMTVGGILSLVLLSSQIRRPLLGELEYNPHLLPILLAVPAIIGIAVQMRTTPIKKTKPAAKSE